MYLSKYVHVKDVGEHTVLYNVLTTKSFFITEEQNNSLKEGRDLEQIFSEDEYNLLSSKGFLQDDNEVSVRDIIQANGQNEPDVFAMYLILTEECNMNCKYCSQSSFRTRKRLGNMSLETIESSINRFYSTNTNRTRTIVLYGGEPTVHMEGVKFAIDYVRNKLNDLETEIIIFTNGILINSEIVDFFATNNVSVILSLDGKQEINDQYRVQGNDGTYHYVNKTIELFNEKGVRFGISATIGPHNINCLEDIVDFFVTEYNPFSIGLNPLHYPPKDRQYLAVDSKEMAQKMVDAYEIAAEYGIYIEQIMRRVRPFILSQPRLKDCPACGGMIRVLPDGSFGPCGHFMEEKKERERSDYNINNSEIMKKWNNRVSCNISGCSDCEALALCGGGCPYNSHINGGDIFSPNDERSCIQAKEFLKFFMKKLANTVPVNTFHEVTESEKKNLLKSINLDGYIPLEHYSRYGEFVLPKRYL